MRLLVTGATGAVGRPAVRALVAAGHDVLGVARSDDKAADVVADGGRPITVDLFDPTAVRDATTDVDGIVNLATSIPSPTRMARPAAWDLNERIRREVSRNLANAAISNGVGVMVQESIAFAYEDRGADWIDESVPVDPGELIAAMVDAEANCQRVTAAGGRGVALRFGNFYGPASSHTQAHVLLARTGVFGLPGDADAWWPMLHLVDAAAAVVASVEAPAGIWNVADEPLTREGHAAALAAAMGRSRLRLPPRAVSRAMARSAPQMVRSQRVSSARFRDVAGWVPQFPSAHEGWRQVIDSEGES